MTWRGKRVIRLAAACLIAAGAFAYWTASERARLRTELKAADERALTAAGALVAQQRTARQIEVAAAVDRNIADALRRIRSQVPGTVKVTEYIQATTGEVETCPVTEALPCPACGVASCLLRPGDSGEVTADIAGVETEHGARALVGTLTAWRTKPGPRVPLLTGPLRADLSQWITEDRPEEPPAPRWKAGPFAGVSTHGWLAGGVLEAPALHIWRFTAEPKVLAAAGPGDVLIGASVTFGFSGRK